MIADWTTTSRQEGAGEWVFAILDNGDHWPVGKIRRRWTGVVEATPWGRPLFGVFRTYSRRRAIRRLVSEDAGPLVGRETDHAGWM